MADQNRRDFMKKTGGAIASTSMPNLGAAGRAINTITKLVKPANIINNILPAIISKMEDIPYEIWHDGATGLNNAHIDAHMLWKFFYPEGKKPSENPKSRSKANPEEYLKNIEKLTGEKTLAQKIRTVYLDNLKKEKTKPQDTHYIMPYTTSSTFKSMRAPSKMRLAP